MTLIDQIAKSMFIRRGQYSCTWEQIPLVPGSDWSSVHAQWDSMTEDARAEWYTAAESWKTSLSAESATTYALVSQYYRTAPVTSIGDLDIL